MDYKCVPFEPSVGREDPVSQISASLEVVIKEASAGGWEFVGLENHSTVVPGKEGGCFSSEKPAYIHTHSVAVFRK